jgi:hypothetical protein
MKAGALTAFVSRSLRAQLFFQLLRLVRHVAGGAWSIARNAKLRDPSRALNAKGAARKPATIAVVAVKIRRIPVNPVLSVRAIAWFPAVFVAEPGN